MSKTVSNLAKEFEPHFGAVVAKVTKALELNRPVLKAQSPMNRVNSDVSPNTPSL